MSGASARRKGRRGETIAKRLLQDRDYTILADTTAGLATDDLLAQDEDGHIWSVEVKNQKTISPGLHTAQARVHAGRTMRWMVLAHIDGTSSWLVLRQGERPSVWHNQQQEERNHAS